MGERTAKHGAQARARVEEALAGHGLVAVAGVRVFYLRRPGTRMMSTLLVFTPEGIALLGDHVPGGNGVVSARFQSLDWFAGRNDSSYLASKFLRREWSPELAADLIDEMVDECPDLPEDQELRELAAELADGHIGAEGLHEAAHDRGLSRFFDDFDAQAYPIDDEARLAGIQRRFAALYPALAARQLPWWRRAVRWLGGMAVRLRSSGSHEIEGER